MKRIIMVVFSAIMCLSMGGTVMGSELISAKELLKYANLSEEDIQFTMDDLDDIISNYELTYDNISSFSEEETKDFIVECIKSLGKYDYSYLFSCEDSLSQYSDQTILRIGVYAKIDALCQSLLIDFENNKYYYDDGRYFWNYVLNAEQQDTLTDEMLEKINKIISERNWPENTNKSLEEEYAWEISIETNEGCVVYPSDGWDLKTGEELVNIMYDLFTLFEE